VGVVNKESKSMKVKSLVDVARALIASAKSRSGNSEGNEDGGDTQEGLKEVSFVKQYMYYMYIPGWHKVREPGNRVPR